MSGLYEIWQMAKSLFFLNNIKNTEFAIAGGDTEL